MPEWTKTTCAYCGVGCGIEVQVTGERQVELRGDPAHPANFGKLCGKGAALADTLTLENRLLHARIKGEQVPLETALDHVAEQLKNVRAQYGPDAIAFYLSGQLLTEDYYVANKLMKGFIGSSHVDTNSRLCMSSAVAAHKRAFGEDIVPGCYEDFDLADLTVFAGSNAAWCHPVLFQRTEAARAERGTRIVTIDPRRTATADMSDLHLPLTPGTDVALFNGLATFLEDRKVTVQPLPADFQRHSIGDTADICGLSTGLVRTFFEWIAETPRWLTVFSQGINQSCQGTDKGNAIINAHVATGRIGLPGAGPFSITGQPNAMGGREVGGLANMLAAHMGFAPDETDRVRRFWQAPAIVRHEGKKAVDLFDAVHAGEIKAVWIMGTNPVASMPNADRVRAALKACDLVIVSDCVAETDTLACADVILPALAWGEKNGTVTNSERRLSRQRGFLSPPEDAKADWQLLCGVAQRMGFEDAFAYENVHEIFAEHAALSGYENEGERLFDISDLSDIDVEAYDRLVPIQWPIENGRGTQRLLTKGTPTPTLVSVSQELTVLDRPSEDSYVLNTGRTRDQWHTMTRTGLVPRLAAHAAEPFVEMNPVDAEREQVRTGDYVSVLSTFGSLTARAIVTEAQRPGEVFSLIHWTDELTSSGKVGRVVNPICDPVSGQPELKRTPATLEKRTCRRQGYILSTGRFEPTGFGYWAERRLPDGFFYSLATFDENERGFDDLIAGSLEWGRDSERLTYLDNSGGAYRAAHIVDGKLVAYLALGAPRTVPDPLWIIDQLGKAVGRETRQPLLAALPGHGGVGGSLICSCMGVREASITEAIAEGAETLDALGRKTGAGTSCGSCRAELSQIIQSREASERKEEAA